jgi:hypothetical protein
VDDRVEAEWCPIIGSEGRTSQMEVRQAMPQIAISKIAEVHWSRHHVGNSRPAPGSADRGTTYRPAVFWAVIIATTTVGTEVSDFLDRSLGLGYFWGSALLLSGLLASLAIGTPARVVCGSTLSFVGTSSCCSG